MCNICSDRFVVTIGAGFAAGQALAYGDQTGASVTQIGLDVLDAVNSAANAETSEDATAPQSGIDIELDAIVEGQGPALEVADADDSPEDTAPAPESTTVAATAEDDDADGGDEGPSETAESSAGATAVSMDASGDVVPPADADTTGDNVQAFDAPIVDLSISYGAPPPPDGYEIQAVHEIITGNLTFILRDTGGVGAGSVALEAFQDAAELWSSILDDNVTVTLDVGFDTNFPRPDILGSTGSATAVVNYEVLRDALRADTTSVEDITSSNALSNGNSLDAFIRDTNGNRIFDNNDSNNNRFLSVNTSVLKALGITTDANGNPINDPGEADGTVRFNSAFSWDFDPTDGLSGGAQDFVGVAFHEIGHAMGFRSGVDVYDANASFNLENFAIFTALDLFRFSGVGTNDLAYGSASFFSVDGGATAAVSGGGLFSTGRVNGDGQQASHWKDNLGIGIMDPTANPPGTFNQVSNADLLAFDVMGWDRRVDNIIHGTQFANTLNGGNTRDFLNGRDGDDTLNGNGGADVIRADDGNDTLNGGGGADVLDGGDGVDTVTFVDAGSGVTASLTSSARGGEAIGDTYTDIENLIGSSFGDSLEGNGLANRIEGGGGKDTLTGLGGNDRLFGGGGEDTLNGNAGADELFGQANDDRLFGGGGDDLLNGGGEADQLFGQADEDRLFGGAGNDLLDGGGEADQLFGEGGNDRLFGGAGNDELDGGAGADELFGQGGNDVMRGGNGNDVLDGGGGADQLFGDADSDTLRGNNGNDFISGGAGADFLFGQANDDELRGGDGNDLLTGGGQNDMLFGDAGQDRLFGGSGNDELFGGAQDDFLSGNDGVDEVNGGDGNDEVFGDAGNDTLFGGNGEDKLDGGTGNDMLFGQANNDLLLGNNGADTLNGGGGNDQLFGQAGNDSLIGGEGNDVLGGGGNSDRFIFGKNSGSDRIVDFTNSEDQIDLSAFGFTGSNSAIFNSQIAPNASTSGSDVVVNLSDGGDTAVIRLSNFSIGNLDASDFIF